MEPRALASANTTPYTTPHKETTKDTKELENTQRALAELSLNKGHISWGPKSKDRYRSIDASAKRQFASRKEKITSICARYRQSVS